MCSRLCLPIIIGNHISNHMFFVSFVSSLFYSFLLFGFVSSRVELDTHPTYKTVALVLELKLLSHSLSSLSVQRSLCFT